jgi:hypothetical protein
VVPVRVMLKGKTPVNLCCLFYIDIWGETEGIESVQHILPEGHGRERTPAVTNAT